MNIFNFVARPVVSLVKNELFPRGSGQKFNFHENIITLIVV
jgi:hypothetical protein